YIKNLWSITAQKKSLSIVLDLINHFPPDIIKRFPFVRIETRPLGHLIFSIHPALNGGSWHIFHFGLRCQVISRYVRKPSFKKCLCGNHPYSVFFAESYQFRYP